MSAFCFKSADSGTLSALSSGCSEVEGCGAVQFGTAVILEEYSAWQNESERSDLKMKTAGCTDVPDCTAI
jgi:hypothetical protein